MTRSAIVTVAMGAATEQLDYTFSSFAEKNPGIPLHAFILGNALPQARLPSIEYHLLKPIPDFAHPLRQVYYQRLAVLDELDIDYALTVDCFDALCLQRVPDFGKLLWGAHVGACVEHLGSYPILGQGYTSNFTNGGVVFWDVPNSRDIRSEIIARGRAQFRTIADDQFCFNEVVQTRYYDRLRILPCQYNYRMNFRAGRPAFGFVNHLDGVVIYHNLHCIAAVKRLPSVKSRAELPALLPDGHPLTPWEQFWRRARLRLMRRLRKYVRSAL